MKKIGALLVALLAFASGATAAPIPQIPYQGYVSDAGAPLNGSHAFTFRLFDQPTAGNLLWNESTSLTVNSGTFSAYLGNSSPLPAAIYSGQTLWLETQIDGNILGTRQAIVPEVLALQALHADTATVALNGVTTGDSLWQSDGTNVWRPSGNVGVGLTNPSTSLDLAGNLKLRLQPTGNNSGMSFNTAPEAPSVGFHASDNSQRFTLATNFFADNANDVLGFDGSIASNILVLKGNGNVGIGTATPGAKLDVAGSVKVSGSVHVGNGQGLYVANADNTGDIPIMTMDAATNVTMQAGNTMYFGLINGGGTVMRINHTGQVDIFGSLTVTGTKCRAVEGTKYGTLYYNAVESSNAVFTTSGRAKLVDGKAHIELDPKWMAGVTIDTTHPLDIASIVFYGVHGTWFATPGTTGFDISESTGATVEFFWTAQASQKGFENIYLNRPEPTVAR